MVRSSASAPAEADVQSRKVVYCDRDGVINKGGQIDGAADFQLLPGVMEAIVSLKEAGYAFVVVTNQGGLGEDLDGKVVWRKAPLTRAKLAEIHDEMLRLLGAEAMPDLIKLCPHAQSIDCLCRKPKPGMIQTAAEELGVKLDHSSFMFGDMATDVLAGIAAGVTGVLINSDWDPQAIDKCPEGTLAFASLKEAVDWILSADE